MGKDVFISYRSTEASVAYMVRDVLERNGIGCWMAPESIESGADYACAIPRGIKECKILVLLLSNMAQESPWVHKEVKMAISNGKIIIPFAIEKCDITEAFSYILADIQRWDAYEALSENLEKLVIKIQKLIAVEGENYEVKQPQKRMMSQALKEILERLQATDYADGMNELLNLAQTTDVEAQYQLGRIYHKVEKDYAAATKWYEMAANNGHTIAQYEMGEFYYKGIGIEVNYKEAFYWYEMSAKCGNSRSKKRLGQLYQMGYGARRDIKKAAMFFEMAAQQGDADAQYSLGELYRRGEGREKNLVTAFAWYEKAYQEYCSMETEGDVDALFMLAEILFNGYYKVKDGEKLAIEYYNKAVEILRIQATQKNAWMQYMLARCLDRLYDTEYLTKYREEATKWYELSAYGKNADAQLRMGDFYYWGQRIEQDYSLAVKWYKMSAEQGNRHASDRLGNMYYKGIGVEKDCKEGIAWYEQGNKLADAEIQYEIGNKYFYGMDVIKNHKKAYEWYANAFRSYERMSWGGDATAQYTLGKMYLDGIGTERDYKKAFQWFEKAEKHGVVKAQYELGNLYYNGFGICQNYNTALKWYEKARKQESNEAKYMLGIMYRMGYGVECDWKKASGYFLDAYKYYRDLESTEDAESLYRLWIIGRYIFANQENTSVRLGQVQYWEFETIDAYEKLAKLGDVNAMYTLANIYWYDSTLAKRKERALEWYKKAAQKGDERAQYELAERYYYGMDVIENAKLAFEWYEKSAQQNYGKAQYKLGYMYYGGIYVEKDEEKAVELMELAAKQGVAEALKELGDAHCYGFGVEVDFKKSLHYYKKILEGDQSLFLFCKKCAEEGKKTAQYLLALMYADGSCGERNSKEALKWYLKSGRRLRKRYSEHKKLQKNRCEGKKETPKNDYFERNIERQFKEAQEMLVSTNYVEGVAEMCELAERGFAEAQYEWGTMLLNGRGMKQSKTKAVRWLKKAAEDGNGEARLLLGEIVRNGVRAQEWYKKALEVFAEQAEQGDAKAQYNLFYMYWHGLGVNQNFIVAMEWCKKAAELGHADALYEWGKRCSSRFECEGDTFVQEAAKLGCKEAQFKLANENYLATQNNSRLGDMTESCFIRAGNIAFEWFDELAKCGDIQSQYMLGEMYYNGYGTPQNYDLAFAWCEKAAKQDFSFAQYKLGFMYYAGQGIAKDKENALKWLKKGAVGNKELLVAVPEELQEKVKSVKTKKNVTEYKLQLCYHYDTETLNIWNENIFFTICRKGIKDLAEEII